MFGQIKDWAKPVPSEEGPKKWDENNSVYRSLSKLYPYDHVLNDRLTFNLSQYDHDLTGFRHEYHMSLEELYIGLLVCSVSINAHIHVFEYKPIWFKASD